MNELLKYLGVFIVLAGVVILVVTVLDTGEKNAGLVLSGLLVIAGLIVHIYLNRKLN